MSKHATWLKGEKLYDKNCNFKECVNVWYYVKHLVKYVWNFLYVNNSTFNLISSDYFKYRDIGASGRGLC